MSAASAATWVATSGQYTLHSLPSSRMSASTYPRIAIQRGASPVEIVTVEVEIGEKRS